MNVNNKLDFSEYDYNNYILPPPRALNGGLFTGEEFKKGSLHANVPVIPDTGYMIHYNLRSANPPPGAIYQYPGTIRPGNNYTNMIGIMRNEKYNIRGNIEKCDIDCKCQKCNGGLTKYFYL